MARKERNLGELMDHLLKQFNPDEAKAILVKAGDAAGIVVLGKVKDEYPPLPPTKGEYITPLQTAKQIRWWWAQMNAIADGQAPPESLRGYKAVRRKVDGVRKLVISGHYKRTGTLVRAIDFETSATRRGTLVEIGPTMGRQNNASSEVGKYADYVIGLPPPEGQQARIHQDRWLPLQLIVDEAADDAYEQFFAVFADEVVARLKGRGWTNI